MGKKEQLSRRQREGKKRNTLECRQRRVALECLGDSARALGIDTVEVETVCEFVSRGDKGKQGQSVRAP